MSDTNFSDYLNELADAEGGVEQVVSEGLQNLKGKIKDVKVEPPAPKEPNPVRDTKVKNMASLADRAINTYKTKINPPIDAPTSLEDAAPKDVPSTIASRENMKAIARSLAGLRSSGNEGKESPVGEHGGNLGKPSPTGAQSGNVSSPLGGYAADVAGMTLESVEEEVEETLEEYQARIMESFGITEGKSSHPTGIMHSFMRGVKQERGAKKDEGGKYLRQQHVKKQNKKEADLEAHREKQRNERGLPEETTVDLIGILEEALVAGGSDDWQIVDSITREVCNEHSISVRELNREFKSQHGMYPDKWISENLYMEECGYYPLHEATLLHKVGLVYDVSFLFRGGRQSFKFFWPTATRPSTEDMQKAVELFYPKARLLAFYPARDQGNQHNTMVVVPPMSENYTVVSEDDWIALSEEAAATIEEIAEEVGEPLSAPVLNEDGEYEMIVADHDTGEELIVTFDEGAAWTRKEGQSASGGLNEKGRKSYERENPGSDLKRPQPEGGKRRTSYCARSKGQQKMHNIDCSKTPDKRICKARRKWNC